MENNCNSGKNNKPTNVKQDNKNKTSGGAQNVKQDNKNSTARSSKLFNDTSVGGNRPANYRREDDDLEF